MSYQFTLLSVFLLKFIGIDYVNDLKEGDVTCLIEGSLISFKGAIFATLVKEKAFSS